MSATAVSPATERARELVKERNISIRRAWQIIQKESQNAAYNLPEVNSIPHNQKSMILAALYANGKAKNIATLLQWLQHMGFDKIDAHNLVHAVWAVQKDGLVRFRENKTSSQSTMGNLERIELTTRGRQKAMEQAEAQRNHIPPASTAVANGHRSSGPIGTDMTNPRNHGQKAQGGPIERSHTTPQPIERKPREVPEVAKVVGHPTDDQIVEQVRAVVEADRLIAAGRRPDIDWARYPLIMSAKDKMTKRSKIEAAAKLLEEVGDFDDDVLKLLDRVEVSALEIEILALLKDLKV
jgi:hypothetical protein